MSINTQTLLVELGCEELPAASIQPMAEFLAQQLHQRLADAGFEPGELQIFSTPRRLAAQISAVKSQQPDRPQSRRGPALKAAFDAEGQPTKAALGFASSCGIDVSAVKTVKTDKGEWLNHDFIEPGATLATWLQGALLEIVNTMPMPKRMRWASHDFTFLRPVEWLVAMHGAFVLPVSLFALNASQKTQAHRFHHPEPLALESAESYADVLREHKVVASFVERRAMIIEQVQAEAARLNAQPVLSEALVDEVACLVEWPVALSGHFDPAYLDAPKEALILTMQDDQRYFALLDQAGALLPSFITVSNIESHDPDVVRRGNERVVNPRLADAMFFWQQDQKTPLGQHLPALKKVTFQEQLGSIHDKVERLVRISRFIASELGIDAVLTERAARLSKCDLQTALVFEFPELQGIAGKYYIQREGESVAVAEALEQQYWPKQAGDPTPEGPIAQVLALSDKVDTLAGIFGIGQKPTGTKDPFALRRASLGVLRILIERQLDLDLKVLFGETEQIFAEVLKTPAQVNDALGYITERYSAYYRDQGVAPQVVEAVLSLGLTRPLDVDRRVQAVAAFQATPEAESLAAANKRAKNILKKVTLSELPPVDPALFSEPSEQALWQALERLNAELATTLSRADYRQSLALLATLKQPVDQFFDQVMVMSEDQALRQNRLALLQCLVQLSGQIADISVL